jgi:hypothetical protein
VVVLTDGARYNHTIVQTHFPGAVHIVDLFHAYEHLTDMAQILWGPEAKARKAWRDWLEEGDAALLLTMAGCGSSSMRDLSLFSFVYSGQPITGRAHSGCLDQGHPRADPSPTPPAPPHVHL